MNEQVKTNLQELTVSRLLKMRRALLTTRAEHVFAQNTNSYYDETPGPCSLCLECADDCLECAWEVFKGDDCSRYDYLSHNRIFEIELWIAYLNDELYFRNVDL